MTSGQKEKFRRTLLNWYGREKRDMPWRRTNDPYAIWISEIMLQQTQVDTVRGYYQRFLKRFPSVEALARAPFEDVARLWAGLGYYRRAQHLHQAAQQVVTRGAMPDTAEHWRDLKGIGRYTANAIASIAQGEAVAVLDGNVMRVLARLFAIVEPINEKPVTDRLWILAHELLDVRAPGDFNQAMMELGALVCTPENPVCPACPVRAFCTAQKQGVQAQLPNKKAAKAPQELPLAALWLQDRDRVLWQNQDYQGLWRGLWRLPLLTQKKNTAADLRQWCRRHGVPVVPGTLARVGQLEHVLSHRHIQLDLWTARTRSAQGWQGQGAWLDNQQINKRGLSALMKKALRHYRTTK